MALGGTQAFRQEFPPRQPSRGESVIPSVGQSWYMVGLGIFLCLSLPSSAALPPWSHLLQRGACAEAGRWGLRAGFFGDEALLLITNLCKFQNILFTPKTNRPRAEAPTGWAL